MATESPSEIQVRLAAGRCCWHCRYYIRPVEAFQLDGPTGNVCTVDRDAGSYATPVSLYAGDTVTEPAFYCDRFEMDLPPETS